MNLYVRNLNYRLQEEELRQVFSQYGEVVSVKIVKDKITGRAKGFGFVEMADRDGGQQALDNLNGTQVGGREIQIEEARPMQPRSNNRY